MKVVLGLLSLVALLGIVYGLALFGVIPTQTLAAKSPLVAKALVTLHLNKPTMRKAALVAARPNAPVAVDEQMIDAEKQQLDAERAQLDQEKSAFEAQQKQALAAPVAASTPPGPNLENKLIALYSTMDPDALALVFAKLPDQQVVQALTQMDEKKAGKAFAALPPDRAAQISRLMESAPRPPSPTVTASTDPAASL